MLTPHQLLDRIDALRGTVHRESQAIFEAWRPSLSVRGFAPSARNLAAYLALRRHDISDLQPELVALGLSSLGRSEGHVMASLDALRASLARIAGVPGPAWPPPGRMHTATRTLRLAQRRFFGADVIGAGTRIMVTLPSEAATDPALVRALVDAGMSCARINSAHDDAAAWAAMAAHVRQAAAEAGTHCTVLVDIGGPKCRIEAVYAPDKVRLFRGDRLVLVGALADAAATDKVIATMSFPEILDALQPGREVWINDGKIGTRVVHVAGHRAELEVISARAKGERLRPEKGLNFPGTELHLSPLTPKDLADLDAVLGIADMLGYSFVQRPEDLALLRGEIARRAPGRESMPVILKIETPLAVRNLPDLIVATAAVGPCAVMIARGDLAVELGFARMAEIQEEIMWLCEAARIPVIWATQVLDSMVRDGSPSRAEATDAAMAQRAECVMLNKGPFLPDAMRFLADILRRMDRHQSKKSPRFGMLHSWLGEG